MYLPLDSAGDSQMAQHLVLHASSFLNISDPSTRPGGWSSIIGIVTAIIGNVLISFALNTQRYAHIRLAREREGIEDDEAKSRQQRKGNSHGSRQGEIAEQRAQKNLKSRAVPDGDSARPASETDPLIPSLNSRASSFSADSGSTVRSNRKPDSGPEKSYLRSPYWWLGISLMTVGEAGNFLAYGFAPASIVSPLGLSLIHI